MQYQKVKACWILLNENLQLEIDAREIWVIIDLHIVLLKKIANRRVSRFKKVPIIVSYLK